MGQKALRFSWKKDIAGRKIKGSEYFVPYSYETLQKLSIFENIFGQDKGVQRSVGGLESYIDNELVEDIDENVGANNPSDIYELSAWDYYCDANAVIRLYNSMGNDSEELQVWSVKELLSRELMFRAKIDISILLSIDVSREHVNEKLAKFSPDIEPVKGPNLNINEYNRGYRINLFILAEFSLYRYLRYIKGLYHLNNFSLDSLRKCAINADKFICEKLNLVQGIIRSVFSCKPKRDYNRLEKYLYGYTSFAKITKKYRQKQGGCFAIMKERDRNLTYFALSGIYDYKDDTKYDNLKIIVSDILFAISNSRCPIKHVTKPFQGYQWAYLKDDVLSYFDVFKPYYTNNIAQVSNPVDLLQCKSFCRGWKNFKSKKNGSYYGCCERKLFAHSDKATDKIFYVRWDPCDLCIPAFQKTKGEKTVYSFAKDFKEYERNKYKYTGKRVTKFPSI